MTVTTTSSSSSAVESAGLGVVAPTPPPPVEGLAELGKAQREVIAQMVPQAKDAGIALTGPDGLLKALTAQVVGAALDEDLNEHLGCRRARSRRPWEGVTSAMAPGLGRWSPAMWVSSRSRCPGIAMGSSSRS